MVLEKLEGFEEATRGNKPLNHEYRQYYLKSQENIKQLLDSINTKKKEPIPENVYDVDVLIKILKAYKKDKGPTVSGAKLQEIMQSSLAASDSSDN